MNSRDNRNNDDEQGPYTADAVDEQIDSLLPVNAVGQQQHAGTRMIHDLTALYTEDAASLDRIWQRLSGHSAFAKANSQAEEAQGLQEGGNVGTRPGDHKGRKSGGLLRPYISRMTPRKESPLQRRLGMVAAVACAILLVGSLVVVLNMTRKSTTSVLANLCTPSGKSALPSAPAVFAEKPGQSGLYLAASGGVYRYSLGNGHLQPLWVFKMNACTAITPTVVPGLKSGFIVPKPFVATAATVANGMVYFGVVEDTGTYLYALHTGDGSLAWKMKVDLINQPLVLNDLLYIETTDGAGHDVIMALSTFDGSVRWSYRYPLADTDQSEGLGAVGDGKVYVSTSNMIFALDAISGKRIWSTNLESGQIIVATRFFDGVLYATASSTCFNCEVLPGTSAAYAFDPGNGKQLWKSQKVAGYLSPPTETGGVVYFGSIDGYLHALRANDGKQIWQSYVYGEVRGAPQVADSAVYVAAGRFLDPTKQSTANGQIVALDTAGHQKGEVSFPGVEIDGSTSIVEDHGVVYVSAGSNFIYLERANPLTFIQRFSISGIPSSSTGGVPPTLTLVL